MKIIKKKSADNAVNQMLLRAFRQKLSLCWDRSEKQQPQCGFSKLCACCNDCGNGPCRINPFDPSSQTGICGKTSEQLAWTNVTKKFSNGTASLAKLAAEKGLYSAALPAAMAATDSMTGPDMKALGACSSELLKAIASKSESKAIDAKANMGVLKADSPNVAVAGFVADDQIAALAGADVNVVTMSGNELAGGFSVATNYVSLETVILTDAVDALLVGNQCVPPALISLAESRGISVAADAAAAAEAAKAHFKARAGKETSIPEESSVINTVTGTAELKKIIDAAAGAAKGVVFLSGCGLVSEIQDLAAADLALQLVQEGNLVIAAGCLGTSIAKAGLCDKQFNGGDYPLYGKVPAPVIFIGACDKAGEVLEAAGDALTTAYFMELTHDKMYATALAFAVSGVDCRVGSKELLCNDYVKEQLAACGIHPLS